MKQAPKQVIVLRKDLNMRKGKMVAQGAHASMAVLLDMMSRQNGSLVMDQGNMTPAIDEWLSGRFAKICVSVDSEHELMEIYHKAKRAGLPCSLIRDAGLTEFKEPTYTAVGIGPAFPDDIDPITGHLKLL